jgi:uncharacterized membrane protein YdfJ with MMPL/SSD domain
LDYEVFLLSGIKEAHDEVPDTNEAVANGLPRSGRIITSTAFCVLIVFPGFAAGQTLGIKEMGLANRPSPGHAGKAGRPAATVDMAGRGSCSC